MLQELKILNKEALQELAGKKSSDRKMKLKKLIDDIDENDPDVIEFLKKKGRI